jgi:sterol desaturase/sphingolipid hydroxylase (fatty acid hydroxylase superfamily)
MSDEKTRILDTPFDCSKNFGIFYAVMDMYFGTATENDSYECPGYSVKRKEENGNTIFVLSPFQEEIVK